MTQPAAPNYLLKYIWCGCKADKYNEKNPVLVGNMMR